ncbi:hypothetical protein HC891_03485 [Candidatus Gracilibacteria bacterium]|nr:hypothetical protein [Candidatus Gracilibacteria bacterium]
MLPHQKGDLTVTGNAVRVNIGSLEPGEVVTITIVARVREAPAAGQNTNVAIVMSITPDGNPDNNTSSVTVDVPRPSAPATAAPATPQPTAVPRPPVLPETGAPPSPGSPLGLLLIGVALIAVSLFLRTPHKRV